MRQVRNSVAQWMVVGALGAMLGACTGGTPGFNPPPGGGGNDPYKPCTDPQTCCAPEELQCFGDPDRGTVCQCDKAWDCPNESKCQKDAPTPGGGSGWDCSWSEFKYQCKKSGTEGEPPAGGNDWTCVWRNSEQKWECTYKYPPNPSNKPDGGSVWNCTMEKEGKILVCLRTDGGGGGGTPDGGVPPGGHGKWNCYQKDGREVCDKEDDNGGLPNGGSDWTCTKHNEGGTLIWTCIGKTPGGSPPPGGTDWNCVKIKSEFGNDYWKCNKKDEPGDKPDGGNNWACAKGSEFNGTRCEKIPTPVTPPTKPSDKCVPGKKYWCDGLQYCGWGQITCKPDGTFPTKDINGKLVLDCQELPDGRRPNTQCACYHFYWNPSCCERPDCMVPEGQNGQICAPSAGNLCDYCNPQKPECKDKNALCVVTSQLETFCSAPCSTDANCPSGYKCIKIKNKPISQCIPVDFSCYR